MRRVVTAVLLIGVSCTTPNTHTANEEIHFPGHYHFQTIKPNQDGMYLWPDRTLMLISDHTAPGLLWIDWRARRILDETLFPGQKQPYHTT
jgi:hypothetical protein